MEVIDKTTDSQSTREYRSVGHAAFDSILVRLIPSIKWELGMDTIEISGDETITVRVKSRQALEGAFDWNREQPIRGTCRDIAFLLGEKLKVHNFITDYEVYTSDVDGHYATVIKGHDGSYYLISRGPHDWDFPVPLDGELYSPSRIDLDFKASKSEDSMNIQIFDKHGKKVFKESYQRLTNTEDDIASIRKALQSAIKFRILLMLKGRESTSNESPIMDSKYLKKLSRLIKRIGIDNVAIDYTS